MFKRGQHQLILNGQAINVAGAAGDVIRLQNLVGKLAASPVFQEIFTQAAATGVRVKIASGCLPYNIEDGQRGFLLAKQNFIWLANYSSDAELALALVHELQHRLQPPELLLALQYPSGQIFGRNPDTMRLSHEEEKALRQIMEADAVTHECRVADELRKDWPALEEKLTSNSTYAAAMTAYGLAEQYRVRPQDAAFYAYFTEANAAPCYRLLGQEKAIKAIIGLGYEQQGAITQLPHHFQAPKSKFAALPNNLYRYYDGKEAKAMSDQAMQADCAAIERAISQAFARTMHIQHQPSYRL